MKTYTKAGQHTATGWAVVRTEEKEVCVAEMKGEHTLSVVSDRRTRHAMVSDCHDITYANISIPGGCNESARVSYNKRLERLRIETDMVSDSLIYRNPELREVWLFNAGNVVLSENDKLKEVTGKGEGRVYINGVMVMQMRPDQTQTFEVTEKNLSICAMKQACPKIPTVAHKLAYMLFESIRPSR